MVVRPPIIEPHVRRHRGRRVRGYPVLILMLEELKAAAPGRRHLIFDEIGKLTGAVREASTFPRWLDDLGVPRTRPLVDRLIRVINAGLLNISTLSPRDSEIWNRLREFADRNYEKFCPRPLTPDVDQLASVSDIDF